MKKGFTLVELIAVIVVLSIITLVTVPSLVNIIKKQDENKKIDTLNSIYMAAENYLIFNNLEGELNNNVNFKTVLIKDLQESNFLKNNIKNPNNNLEFSNRDAVKIIKKPDGTYDYEIVYLKSLIEILKEQSKKSSIIMKDVNNPNQYYFSGDNSKVNSNYLWYGGFLWRIVSFNTELNTIKLVSDSSLGSILHSTQAWNNLDNFRKSYLGFWLNGYFYSELLKNINVNDLNTVDYKIGDKLNASSKIGLLTDLDYNLAGGLNSYLNIKDNWTLGIISGNSIKTVNSSGNIINGNILVPTGIRPVINISDIIIKDGNGTLNNNYKILTNSDEQFKLNIGDYVNFRTMDNMCGNDKKCLFRIIKNEPDYIKLSFNGVLPIKSIFGEDCNATINKPFYTSLNRFKNSLEIKDFLVKQNFYIGQYDDGNYTDFNFLTRPNGKETISSDVGLPVIGELLSSNDLKFNDIEYVENKEYIIQNNVKSYWSFNRYSTGINTIGVFNDNSSIKMENSNSNNFIRPVIVLNKEWIKNIQKGDGSPNSPYELK